MTPYRGQECRHAKTSTEVYGHLERDASRPLASAQSQTIPLPLGRYSARIRLLITSSRIGRPWPTRWLLHGDGAGLAVEWGEMAVVAIEHDRARVFGQYHPTLAA